MMNDIKVTEQIKRAEVWTIAFAVTLSVWLVALVAVALYWDQLCARITINALEYGMEQMATPQYRSAIPPMRDRRATSRRTKPWQQLSHAEKVEKVRAGQERSAPSETFAEELNRLDREREELEDYLFDDQDPNKR